MALETATYISDLNASNPAASDAISTADDHLRLLKSTLKATFPNIDGPVTVDQDDINGLAPLASPTFTGTPAAPTASAGTNTTQIATTAFVTDAVDTATGSLGTLSTQDSDSVSITGGSITGITDLAVADGGTGASTAGDARTNLGLGSLATLSTIDTAQITDAAVTPAKLSQPLTSDTAKNSTSGTSVEFTGIPSWVKRITVMYNGVSTNGSSLPIVQLGSSSFKTSGYTGRYFLSTGYYGNISSGFIVCAYPAASETNYGSTVLTLLGGNTWVCTSTVLTAGSGLSPTACGGVVTLTGSLDRVRVTTVNGTDSFDAGSINILYE